MAATTKQLETRLAKVEKELAELRETLAAKAAEPWYRQIVGSFADDKAFAEIIRLGRLIRAARSRSDLTCLSHSTRISGVPASISRVYNRA